MTCILVRSNISFVLLIVSMILVSCHRIASFVKAKSPILYCSMSSLPTFSSNLNNLFVKKENSKSSDFLFVGGKGGVGKTSTSSAIAIAFSDQFLRTLVVSTDPAHSLGDALGVNLSNGKINQIVTESNLWALEIDVDAAMESFRSLTSELDIEVLSSNLGIPKDILESLGLNDLTGILTNAPPGIDEIVALTNIFQYAKERDSSGRLRFDRIVIDTAPTGHTLRLLQLPEFLTSFTGKLIKFRSKFLGMVDSLKSMFGGNSNGSSVPGKLNDILGKLEVLQENMANLKNTLQDAEKTQFAVVTIPTELAVAESSRLVQSLNSEGIKVSSIICNQVISDNFGLKYVESRQSSQQKCIEKLRSIVSSPIEVSTVPYCDTEVVGLFGLRYFASLAHPVRLNSATNPIQSKKLTIFSGKGGVGKTSSAAAWGVQLSDHGLKTLVVSTDPAHSLGDAFQEHLSGTPKKLDVSAEGGQLWAMEIDPELSIMEFQDAMKSALGPKVEESAGGGFMNNIGLGQMKNDLMDLISGINDPPPGTDEIAALVKLMSYLESGYENPDGSSIKFDRIILDTAPTGHTLRMLELPQFLLELIKKFKAIRDKSNSIGGMLNMMGMGNQNSRGSEGSTKPQGKLEEFEDRLLRLQDLIHSSDTEFTVVTIPTELATAESARLLSSLKQDNILVRRVLVNQVIPLKEDGDRNNIVDSYLKKLRQGQMKSIQKLNHLASEASCPIIQVPYFDMEVTTVYGLRAITNAIFTKE